MAFRISKKTFLALLILINLTLIARILFLLHLVTTHMPNHCNDYLGICASGILSYLCQMFLSITGIINIYNWSFFIARIRPLSLDKSRYKEKCKTLITYGSLLSSILIMILYGIGMIWRCTYEFIDSNKSLNSVPIYMNSISFIIFLCLGTSFFIAGR